MTTEQESHFGSLLIKRFIPPEISPRAAERAAQLATQRAPFPLIQDLLLELSAGHSKYDWSELGIPVEVVFSAAGETGYIRTVSPLLRRVLAYAEVMLSDSDLDAELSAFLLENTLVERFSQLEEILGGEVNFLRIAEAKDHDDLADLSFSVLHGKSGMRFPGVVYASAPLLAAIVQQWENVPAVPFEPEPLRFSLCARAAMIDLSISALHQLEVGDAMLFDRVAIAGGAVVTLQETLFAAAQFDESGTLVLAETFSIGGHDNFGDFLMDQQDDTKQEAVSNAQIDDLPVRLVFELGRTELSLDQLRALNVGSPLPLDKGASSSVDIIANGRRIGAGEMIMIGDQLGVRVTRLVGNA